MFLARGFIFNRLPEEGHSGSKHVEYIVKIEILL
jgi:hypothetical protein